MICQPVRQPPSPSTPRDNKPPPSTSTRAFSRKNRVYVFRKFLVETYGDYLTSKAQENATSRSPCILDVAGGKGDLSWLLCNVDGWDSVCADPRVPKDKHMVKGVAYLRQHPEECQRRAIPGRPTHQPLAELVPLLGTNTEFRSPKHLRILVDDALVKAVRQRLASGGAKSGWEAYWVDSLARGRTIVPMLGSRQNEQRQTGSSTGGDCEGCIRSAEEAWATISSLHLVVGFHPDQATEPCVDLALLLQIPFCVVPCCVFPSEFPHRRTEMGEPVRKYEEFVPFLLAKDPRIKTQQLAFHDANGKRNTVLYVTDGAHSKG